jgi:ABC-2 type transport system ATP-binding protein
MLRVEGLRKTYGERVAVEGLDMTVASGEVVALLGPNGAGKSTTIQCIVGLGQQDAGTITVDGIDLRRDPVAARRRIAYVPEVAHLYEALTPNEFLLLKGRLFGLSDDAIHTAAKRLLGGFGLAERADDAMVGFSKGMLQRVSLAAALATQPRLLILDEPHSGLDVETSLVLRELVVAFARRGGAVLLCSHLLDVVENLADRIVLLDRGRVQAAGTLAELRARAGAAANLADSFRHLTQTADPALRAAAILGPSDADHAVDTLKPGT